MQSGWSFLNEVTRKGSNANTAPRLSFFPCKSLCTVFTGMTLNQEKKTSIIIMSECLSIH